MWVCMMYSRVHVYAYYILYMDTVLEYYTCVYTAVGFGMLRSTQPLEFVLL